MDYALELNNLCKSYDDFTLDHINLSLPTGSIMGFIGENGAGKSTTIKLILDLVHKDNGSIKIFGKDQKNIMSLSKEDIGVVMDDCCFPEILNIKQINQFMSKLYKHWNSTIFSQYVNKFNLPNKKPISDLSKGMKRKLDIACALSHGAKLLILDEATSGLDPIVRDEILDIFLDFIQDETHSIFVSSHITSDLEKICDYVSLIHKGKIKFTESKDTLKETYGIFKGSMKDLLTISSINVISYKENQFGVEALVMKHKVPKNFIVDNATLEDIMLFYIRGKKLC